jgi:hypothetical protein
VYFFKPGKDWLSCLVCFAGWFTGQPPTFTHIAIGHHQLDELFHFTLGGGETVALDDLYEWSPDFTIVSIPMPDAVDARTLAHILAALQYSKGTTIPALLELLFKRKRGNYHRLICTDLPNLARGMLPWEYAATPDDLYTLYTELYGSQDGEK